MNEQRLNVDISVLRRGHGKLTEETAILRTQTAKLLEAVCELDSCWEPQTEFGFKNESLPLLTKLNSLTDGMTTLTECMDFALKTYLGCENAAADSIRATNL